MAGEEALPGRALEIRDRDVLARIDVHRLLLRAEGVEERDAVLARRDGVFPLEHELDRDMDRLGGVLERGLAGAQAGEAEDGALDARLLRHERDADRGPHGDAPVADL